MNSIKILVASPEGDCHLWGVLAPQQMATRAQWCVESRDQLSPAALVRAVTDFQPDFILLTCLLSTGVPGIHAMLGALQTSAITLPVILGGLWVTPSSVDALRTAYSGPLIPSKNVDHSLEIIRDYHQSPTPLSEAPLPPIADFMPRHYTDISVQELWDDWIPPRSLYTLHLGYRGPFEAHLAQGHPDAVSLFHQVQQVKEWALQHHLIQPRALSRWFSCQSEGNTIRVQRPGQSDFRVSFPRQQTLPKRCLSDYVSATRPDVMGVLYATAGNTHPTLKNWVSQGRFQEAKILHALTVQTAEALTENIHFQLRQEAGLSSLAPTADQINQAGYPGKRFSFGYSACPDLTQQQELFALLDPATIGITLTPLSMMSPEASVSAMVFCHPEAAYFSI